MIFVYLAALLMILGAALLVALLFFAPAIQQRMYYLLLACGIGGVSAGLFIYVFIFGEIQAYLNEKNGSQNK